MRRIASLVAATLAVTGLTIGCASDRSIIAQATQSHEQLEPAIITDAQLAGYVQQIGDRIVASAREMVDEGFKRDRVYKEDPTWMFEEVQFHLVNSDTLNAFTTGGTHVYLYSELFRTTKNEDEFAAVVAHEFAHVVGRHVAKGTDRQYGILGAAALAGVGGYALGGDNRQQLAMALGGGTLAAGQFFGMGFTRDDETEADDFGFQFYANAGYDPDRFGGFFQTLIDKGLDGKSEMMSDHPLLKNRVQAAEKWSAEWKEEHPNWKSQLRDPIASDAQFRKYQQRASAVAKTMPNDQTLAAAKLMFNAFPSCVAPTDQPTQTEARQELSAIVNEQASGQPANGPQRRTKAQKRREAQRGD